MWSARAPSLMVLGDSLQPQNPRPGPCPRKHPDQVSIHAEGDLPGPGGSLPPSSTLGIGDGGGDIGTEDEKRTEVATLGAHVTGIQEVASSSPASLAPPP